MRSEKGVTLIFLIVTIIILIILTGIVINSSVTDNGLINETIEVAKTSFDDNVRDSLLTLQLNYTSKNEYLEFLKNNNYIDENNVINIQLLLNTNDCDYGVGSDMKDVYILTNDLDLKYYYEDGSEEQLENIGTSMQP